MAHNQRTGPNYISDVVVAEKATSQFSWSDRVVGSGKCLVEAGSWLLKAYLLFVILSAVVSSIFFSAILRAAHKRSRRCR